MKIKQNKILVISIILFLIFFLIISISMSNRTYGINTILDLYLTCHVSEEINSDEIFCDIFLNTNDKTILGLNANYLKNPTVKYLDYIESSNCGFSSCYEVISKTDNGFVVVNINGIKGNNVKIGTIKIKLNDITDISNNYNVGLNNIELCDDKYEVIPIRDNPTLEINQYTVAFNSDGGSNVASQTIIFNGKATKPSNPTKIGYTFKEWQLNGKTYDFNTAVTGNITLKALWEIIEEKLIDILKNNHYSVKNSLVIGFNIGDTIVQIKNKLGNNVTIVSKTSIISTGTIIEKGDESYTVVIKGDLNGDGKINSGDLLQMRKHMLEDIILDGAYKEAGIIESNNEIKSLDLLRLRQYLLGEYSFK